MKHALRAVAALLAVSAGAHAVEPEDIEAMQKAFNERPKATPDSNWRKNKNSRGNNKCGPWDGIELGPANLKLILSGHAKWTERLPNKETGLSPPSWDITEPMRANLCGANLVGAVPPEKSTLRRADLTKADLSGVVLSGADLRKANLFRTKLSGARFEPDAGKYPDLWAMRKAFDLHEMRYVTDPDALVALRKEFEEKGRRDLERQITYAIKHSERINTGGVEGALTLVLFEMTSDYGMSPGRPLKILLVLIGVFSFFYVAPIVGDTKAGVYRVSDDTRPGAAGDDQPRRLVEYGLAGLGFVVYFSLLSAFHIGWRDLNVGNWIARIFPRDYRLRGKGWVKAVSGLQSLISVYLLALSALTYFGRPFG